ncbi:MAG: hypothetical protein GAK43_01705 [Stenotrophomonas maltophilia]|nr:MAG: hypothetical protein GAK43_01705 [Stenotrophomonas maltophilia]
MSAATGYGRLALTWWLHLLLALGPLLLLLNLDADLARFPALATPAFVVGLFSMFLTLPFFRCYKHALIAAGRAHGSADAPAAWVHLARARCRGALVGSLPAWIGALALFCDLHAVAALMLGFASLIILWLYRLPRLLR